jgi:glycosyltransferase involved in cell wall biosynthesis
MSSALVHAHVSKEESFGLTVLEALLAGTAVLGGSNSGAVPWILESGKAGLLVDIEDPNRIAEGICQLLTNSKLRRNLVRRGKRRSETLFSPEAAVDAHLALYENALLDQTTSPQS